VLTAVSDSADRENSAAASTLGSSSLIDEIVRNRSKITKGPGSRAAGIAMAYKLIEAAQSRGRAVNAPRLVALVRADAKFENGTLVERPDEGAAA
jgi:hypothetical protein